MQVGPKVSSLLLEKPRSYEALPKLRPPQSARPGAWGARVQRIERSEFRHGPTRNLLAAQARGELLVFLSQDALPDGSDFLKKLTAPFHDPRVAGSTARVLPHEDDDPLTARTVLSAPEAATESAVCERADLEVAPRC